MKTESPPPPIGSMVIPDKECLGGNIRWLGDDGANVFIDLQGQLCVIQVRKGPNVRRRSGRRGKCLPFSAASRLRLLRLVNRMDWSLAGRCSFVTLTYTDRTGRPSPEQITDHRSRFQRWFEERCQQKVGGLWRVEWCDRLRGKFVGQPMPHVHVVSFGCPWVDKWSVKRAWMRIIGERENASTDIRGIRNLQHCMHYIGKYIGKLPDKLKCCSLGVEAYLNIGRSWGKYRPDLLPLGDRVQIRVPPSSLVARIRAIARAAWKGVQETESAGFSVFGPASKEISKLLEEYSGRVVATGVGYCQPHGRGDPS